MTVPSGEVRSHRWEESPTSGHKKSKRWRERRLEVEDEKEVVIMWRAWKEAEEEAKVNAYVKD